jgi:Uncharacterised protein family (UPF0104).
MPCLIWAMGFPVPYIQSVLLQALLIFLLYFVPTPGGSGVAEGGAAAVFSLFVPWELAGVLAVGWRLLLEYTGGSVRCLRCHSCIRLEYHGKNEEGRVRSR